MVYLMMKILHLEMTSLKMQWQECFNFISNHLCKQNKTMNIIFKQNFTQYTGQKLLYIDILVRQIIVIFSTFRKFWTWKLLSYRWCKHVLLCSISKLGNWITKGCKAMWFLWKKKSHSKCCRVKNTALCLWLFVKNLTRKHKKDLLALKFG